MMDTKDELIAELVAVLQELRAVASSNIGGALWHFDGLDIAKRVDTALAKARAAGKGCA